MLLGSFGASCVLLFGYPEQPFAQPANVILGHLVSAAVGLLCLRVFGAQPWSLPSTGRLRAGSHGSATRGAFTLLV